MNETQVIGIDLGTTNSLAAVVQEGKPCVLADREGRSLLPSVVSFLPSGEVLTGHAALAEQLRHPGRTVHSIKRLIGKKEAEVSGSLGRLPYEVVALEGGRLAVETGGALRSPEEISALILAAVRERAEQALGVPVKDAVITVPAYFDDAQRQATRDAGRIAGLRVLRILNEPTAAALAYGLQTRKEGAIAVYDLGGGTFDISILQVAEGVFRVLSTHGDTFLGGDDFDAALVDFAIEKLGLPQDTPLQRQALRKEAERVKIALSEQDSATLLLEGRRLPVSRAEFEELVAPVVERTFASVRQALSDAMIEPREIDEIVLVGGATRVPLVRRRVAEFFGREPHTELNPDEVVALGAAVQAGILSGANTEMVLLDVIPLSLGLETMGGAVAKLIERNQPVPARATQLFTTYADGQTAVDFSIVQGERELASDNRLLGRFKLRGIPPMPAGLPKIRVTFAVDESGILTVTAVEERSGRAAKVEVVPAYNLPAGEVDRLIEEAYDNAEEDYRRRMLAEIRIEADQIIRATEKALRDAGNLAGEEDTQAVAAAMDALRHARHGEEFRAIKNAYDRLNELSRPWAERIMDAAVHDALADRRLEDLD